MSSNSGQEATVTQKCPEFQLLRVHSGKDLVHHSQNAFIGIRDYSILGKNYAGTYYQLAYKDFLFLSASFTCRVVPLVSSRTNCGYDLLKLRNVDSKKWSPQTEYYMVFIFPELMCLHYSESTYVFGVPDYAAKYCHFKNGYHQVDDCIRSYMNHSLSADGPDFQIKEVVGFHATRTWHDYCFNHFRGCYNLHKFHPP